MKSLAIITLGMAVAMMILTVIPASAQDSTYQLQTSFSGQPETVSGPADYLRRFYVYGLSVVGLLAMARIVYAAIKLIASAGNPAAVSEARGIITQSLWGIALLAGAYLILYTINPNLVKIGAIEESISKRLEPLDPSRSTLRFRIDLDSEIKRLQLNLLSTAARSAKTLEEINTLKENLEQQKQTLATITDPTARFQLERGIAKEEINLQGLVVNLIKNEVQYAQDFLTQQRKEITKLVVDNTLPSKSNEIYLEIIKNGGYVEVYTGTRISDQGYVFNIYDANGQKFGAVSSNDRISSAAVDAAHNRVEQAKNGLQIQQDKLAEEEKKLSDLYAD